MLDTKEERKYEQLRKLGQELHIPIPEAFWTLEVFDKDGKLIQRHHQRSHSWVRNAYNLLFCTMACKAPSDATFGAGKLSIKDTGAVVKSSATCPLIIIYPYNQNPDIPTGGGYLAQAGEDNHGILVGSGTNAEDFEDYALQTPLAEGTGAGQISHVASELHSMSYAALVLTDELIRYFNNNSSPAGDRNINEVALATQGTIDSYADWLHCRDKLASTVTVPVTGQLKVTYTVQLTYPS